MNKEKFERTLVAHKRLIAKLIRTQDMKMMVGIVRTADELCLTLADYKCQKCGAEDRLQFHHLILRTAKKYFGHDKFRYLSQRHYWANILILCVACHDEYHDRKHPERDEKLIIDKERIEKIRGIYA